MKMLTKFCVALLILLLSATSIPVHAYYTNMPAEVVIGQADFASGAANRGGSAAANTLANPYKAVLVGQKLVVSDITNERVLIYNSIPTTNGVAADVVIGQSNMTSTSTNQGISRNANTFSSPEGLATDGQRLFVTDTANHRVLIFNSLPTTNNASANVVIGQPDFTSGSANQGGSVGANTLNVPTDVWYDSGKLFIADSSNNRVLIYNSVPTTNNASADVVVGQQNFSSNSANQGSSPAANTMWIPGGVFTHQGKLITTELTSGGNGNRRVLIFNSIPTSNNASADVVVGQPDFASRAANQGGSANANTIVGSRHPWAFGGRLFIPEDQSAGNNRVLIFNTIPTSNNAWADLVIGQQNFTGTSANQGGTRAANTLNRPTGGFATSSQLFVVDRINSRILIYPNQITQPGLSLNNSPELRENNQLRFRGTVTVASPNVAQSVQFAVNGGGFVNATPTDGGFNSGSEEFYFDIDPTANLPKDSSGYTIQMKAVNNNADTTDHLFYFSPFVMNSPSDGEVVKSSYHNFDFSVNTQRTALRDNLDHYAIQVRDLSSGGGWTTLIDNIPVDFATRKNDVENLQKAQWESRDVTEGTYETDRLVAVYSEQGARIAVHSKITPVAGTVEWKVVAVDKAGHSQETGARKMVAVGSTGSVTPGFPLAVLNISGLGNPKISSYNLSGIKPSYKTSSTAPVFYGIAWSGATVKLQLTQQNCSTNCTQEFTTSANVLSRFGINIPPGALKRTQAYQVRLSVQLGSLYTELPSFLLTVK